MNTFVIADPARCIGCRTCEVACVLAHSTGGLQGLSAAHFIPRLTVVRTAKVSAPVQCHQCEDAPCAAVCSTNAITFTSNSVQVNQERCVGCKSCMIACPYGAMDIVTMEKIEHYGTGAGERFVRVKKIEAQKCDLCITKAEGPNCIRVCPTKALRMIDQKSSDLSIRKRKELAAEESAARTY
jgi:electron transport protein HydN